MPREEAKEEGVRMGGQMGGHMPSTGMFAGVPYYAGMGGMGEQYNMQQMQQMYGYGVPNQFPISNVQQQQEKKQ